MSRNSAIEFKDGEWVPNLPEEDYHAIKTHKSSSQLKCFHDCELKYEWHHVLNQPVPDSPTKRFGRLFHAASLTPELFFGNIEERKTAPKGELFQKGVIPISEKDLEAIKYMLARMQTNPIVTAIMKEGDRELSGFFTCPDTGMKLRIRADLIWRQREWIVDMKTTRDLSDRFLKQSIEDYRYDFSAAMYCHGSSIIEKKTYDKFIWIFVQNCPPYDVRVIPCSEQYMEVGRWDYDQTKKRLKVALESGEFKGYPPEAVEIGPNYWHYERAMKEIEDESAKELDEQSQPEAFHS